MNEKVMSWILPRISIYRSIGFFTQFGNLSDAALIHKLSTLQDERGKNRILDIVKHLSEADYEMLSRQVPYWNFGNELDLLCSDNQRVWRGDIECDAGGGGVYATYLEKWSRISRQAFSPKMISEKSVDDNGWIEIGFTLGAVVHHLQAKWNYDWLDPHIIPQIKSSWNQVFNFVIV